MREYNSNVSLKPNKLATTNQNQIINTTTTTSTKAKLKSSSVWGSLFWGSHIVKGFSNSNSKQQQQKTSTTTTVPSKKKPLLTSASSTISNNHRIKRSILGKFACSTNNASQVYPTHTTKSSSSSRDLFLELDHLRGLLRESKERENELQEELKELAKEEAEEGLGSHAKHPPRHVPGRVWTISQATKAGSLELFFKELFKLFNMWNAFFTNSILRCLDGTKHVQRMVPVT